MSKDLLVTHLGDLCKIKEIINLEFTLMRVRKNKKSVDNTCCGKFYNSLALSFIIKKNIDNNSTNMKSWTRNRKRYSNRIAR